jgi:hypothetical protein
MNAIIGQPISRVDGPAKVTGQAIYAAEFNLRNMAYAALVHSTIACGRIDRLDTAQAEQAPGVLSVISHLNAERLPYEPLDKRPPVDPKAGEQLHVFQVLTYCSLASRSRWCLRKPRNKHAQPPPWCRLRIMSKWRQPNCGMSARSHRPKPRPRRDVPAEPEAMQQQNSPRQRSKWRCGAATSASTTMRLNHTPPLLSGTVTT